MRPPDPIFSDPRLAAVYDDLDGRRDDLDAYVDPAAASLAVARAKPAAERVTWVDGDATALASLDPADLVLMTGNVAQVFVADADWSVTLDAVRSVLRPGGWLAFETRRPDGVAVPSRSTLRFRTRVEVEADLAGHGFDVVDVREAPDRPGRELVFVACRR